MNKHRIVVLSGAGVSAESGLKTFRDADGLWEGHDISEVATPEAWHRNMDLVLQFYNERRKQLLQAGPNEAHRAIARLQDRYDTLVITQNVDDLHERAGSGQVLHLHGELLKVRSTGNPSLVYSWHEDLKKGDLCEEGHQLRPHIVWFGEEVPLLTVAAEKVAQADIVIVVGTSLQVYPAAGLVNYAPPHSAIYYVDPRPANLSMPGRRFEVIREKAGSGIPELVTLLLGR